MISIILLGIVVITIELGNVPGGFNQDEAFADAKTVHSSKVLLY